MNVVQPVIRLVEERIAESNKHEWYRGSPHSTPASKKRPTASGDEKVSDLKDEGSITASTKCQNHGSQPGQQPSSANKSTGCGPTVSKNGTDNLNAHPDNSSSSVAPSKSVPHNEDQPTGPSRLTQRMMVEQTDKHATAATADKENIGSTPKYVSSDEAKQSVVKADMALSPHQKPTRSVPMPQRGSMCRVFCKTSSILSRELKGKEETEAEWFPAKIEKVTWARGKANLLLRYFDQTSTTVHYTHSESPRSLRTLNDQDFEMLIPVSGSSTAFQTVWKGERFYDRDPTGVEPGDRVQGFFQNGEGGTSTSWFSGRVVDVRGTPEKLAVCDILYDDGDYEKDIPLSSNNVHLIQKGQERPEWLIGLPLHREKKGRGVKLETAVVDSVEPKGVVKLALTDSKTKKVRFEKTSYSMAVDLVLKAACLTVAEHRTHHWFEGSCPVHVSVNPSSSRPQCNRKKCASKTTVKHTNTGPVESSSAKPNAERPVLKTLGHVATQEKSRRVVGKPGKENDTTMLGINIKTTSEFTVKRNGRRPKETLTEMKTKRRGRKKVHLMEQVTEEAKFVSMQVFDHQGDGRLIKPHHDDSSCSRKNEIHPALGKALEKSLHSCFSHIGSELLNFTCIYHNRSPTLDIRKSLVTLMLRGPTSGTTTFPDCQRMQLGEKYLHLTLAQDPKIHEQFIKDAGTTFWTDCLNCLMEDHYTLEGDEVRMTNFAINRVAQSVHVKACCAEFFLRLLEYELGDYPASSREFDIHNIDERKLLKDIAGHRRGPKEALEKFWNALVKQWLLLGHFILGEPTGLLQSEENVSKESLHFLQEQSSRLLTILGRITSHMAWLHHVLDREDQNKIAHLLYNNASRLLDQNEFDPSPFFSGYTSLNDHWNQVRLRLVLDLDKRIVPEVRPILADLMDVGAVFNIIFAY